MIHLRWMVRRDMPEVLSIERQSFEFPWSERDFMKCLRKRSVIGMVAEDAPSPQEYGTIQAFMIYELHKYRIDLISLAVHPDSRRSGIGRQLVEKLRGKLSPQRRNRITCGVRESNLPALNFFKAVGFHATLLVPGCYDNSEDDAIVMVCRCPVEVEA